MGSVDAAAKDKKSLLHPSASDVTKSKRSLCQRSRAERRRERRGGEALSVLSALTPTLQRAIRSQKCSRFNLFKADPIFSPSSGELERGVRGRKSCEMRYRERLISRLPHQHTHQSWQNEPPLKSKWSGKCGFRCFVACQRFWLFMGSTATNLAVGGNVDGAACHLFRSGISSH